MRRDPVSFDAVVDELRRRNAFHWDESEMLAGFIYGKYLSPYSYMDTPKSIADAWIDCRVRQEVKNMLMNQYRHYMLLRYRPYFVLSW